MSFTRAYAFSASVRLNRRDNFCEDQLVAPDVKEDQGVQPLEFSEMEQNFLHVLEHNPLAIGKGFPEGIRRPYLVLRHSLRERGEKFTLTSSKHLHELSIAFHYLNSKNLEKLTESDREICLRLHEAYRKWEVNTKIPPYLKDTPDTVIDGIKISKTLGRLLIKFCGAEAIGQCLGFVAKDLTLSDEDFERIFPKNSFKDEAIPALLNSDIKLTIPLQQMLSNRYLKLVGEQNKNTHVHRGSLDQQNTNTCESFAMEDICDFAEHLKNSEERISPDQVQAVEKFVQHAEMTLPTEEALVVELRKAETAKEKSETQADKQEILKKAVKISIEVGRAIHTWMQHSNKEERHLKTSSTAYKEFSACLTVLGLEDSIQEFQYKSRPEIQKLIERKLIDNHESALEKRIAVAKEFESEVANTKKALEDCRKSFGELGLQGKSLRELGSILNRYQKKVDHYYKKRSNLLNVGNAICDGITIAGQIASAFVPGGALVAAEAAAGVAEVAEEAAGKSKVAKALKSIGLVKMGLDFLNSHNASQWAKSQKWYKKQLGQSVDSAKILQEGREAAQAQHFNLINAREQQRDFLIVHPELFLSIPYQRLLLEELIEEKNGLDEIQKREQECQASIHQNSVELEKLTESEKNLATKLNGLSQGAHPHKYESTLARLVHVRTQIARKTGENSLWRLELDRLQDSLTAGNRTCETIERRVDYFKQELLLPEHHRSDAGTLPLDTRIKCSDAHLIQLQGEVDKGHVLAPEEYKALHEKRNDELLFNTQLKQTQVYQLLREEIPTNISKHLPMLFWDSIERQNKLETQIPCAAADCQSLRGNVSIAKAKFSAAQSAYYDAGIQDKYLDSQKKMQDAQASLNEKLKQIQQLLPDRKVKYRFNRYSAKIELNLQDYTHPNWKSTLLNSAKKSEQANINKAIGLIDEIPVDQKRLKLATDEKTRIEKEYQQSTSEVEDLQKGFQSLQESREKKETWLENLKNSKNDEQQLQNTFWNMAGNMPPKERIEFTENYQALLKENKTKNAVNEQTFRSQQTQCLQISLHAYRQQWDGVDPAQRVNLFAGHQASSAQRISEYNSMLADIKSEIHAQEQMESIDQKRLDELQQNERDLQELKAREENNQWSLTLDHNYDQKILDLRAIRGESDDWKKKALYVQHSEHLKQIGQHQALQQWTNLSQTFELLLGEYFASSEDRELRHKSRMVPRLITQMLSVAAGLTYMWSAGELLATDAKAAIKLTPKNESTIQQSEGFFSGLGQMASFFANMPLVGKVEGYFIPTLTVVHTFIQITHIIRSIVEGPAKTLQENFSDFAKEQTKVLQHYHSDLKEQLKGNYELLQKVDQKLSQLHGQLTISCKKLGLKIEASQQKLESKLDAEARKSERKECLKYCTSIKDKRDEMQKPLLYFGNDFQQVAKATLGHIQYDQEKMHRVNNNGESAGEYMNALDISGNPKYFTGWLGSQLAQQGAVCLNSHLPLPSLLISTASSFLNLFKEMDKHKETCPSTLKEPMSTIATGFREDIKSYLLMITQHDDQLARTATALETIQLSEMNKLKEAKRVRHEAILTSSMNGIAVSKKWMQALVVDPSLFTQRFALTRNVVHLLDSHLPPIVDKVSKLLPPIDPPSLIAGSLTLLAFAAPFAISTPAFLIGGPLLLLGSAYSDYYAPKKIYSYDREGQFGSQKVNERFEQISLIALAQLSLPETIQVFKSEFKHESDNRRNWIRLSITSGSTESLPQVLVKLEASSLSTSKNKWVETGSRSYGSGHWKETTQKEVYDVPTESMPLVEANVTVHFNEGLSRKAEFTKRSWVQCEDLKAIEQIRNAMDRLQKSQEESMEIASVYMAFLEAQKAVNSPTSIENPFGAWLGDYQLVPASKEGIPIALPKRCLEMMDAILQAELDARHFSNQPSLIPFYEWRHYEAIDVYSLEIVIKTNEADAVDCHHFTLFSLQKDTVDALRGKLETCSAERQFLLESATLLYVMYCGFWNLGMPTNNSYKLVSGKAMLSSDAPFAGWYKQLELNLPNCSAMQVPELKKLLDWQYAEKGERLVEKATRSMEKIDKQFFKNSLFLEYRHQYYLATSLAKLQSHVEAKKSDKQQDDVFQYEMSNTRAMFADNGLPWPETFELSKEYAAKSPQIEVLKTELDFLPVSKTVEKLVHLYFELEQMKG